MEEQKINLENTNAEIGTQTTNDLASIISSLDDMMNNESKSLDINEENEIEAIETQSKENECYNDLLRLIDSIPTDISEWIKQAENCNLVQLVTEDEVPVIENIDSNIPEIKIKFKEAELKANSERKKGNLMATAIKSNLQFLAYYTFISTIVFIVLLWSMNFSAYSKIAYNMVNPGNLKASSHEILTALDNSRIKVFADEDSMELRKDEEDSLQKKLSEENLQLRDTYFSPKKLVPLKSSVDLSVDVVPYENRIIIPKLWKNVPLVNVDSRRWTLDFANLENIFMDELSKWIVRYPGTAIPWDTWNAFIFWHSSNYPWMKWDYNDVFALLDNVSFWDEIIAYYNQKKYVYVVKEKTVVKPGNVKILERDPSKKELSLMTCWPVWTSLNRLIVFAELKEEK